METCASCRFYEPHNNARNDGYCRRHAPSPIVNQQNMKNQVLQLAEWPTVSGNSWCGEHKPPNKCTCNEQPGYVCQGCVRKTFYGYENE